MSLRRHIPSLSLCLLLGFFFFVFMGISPSPLSAASQLTIDKKTLKQELRDALVEKLFSDITNASEEKLKDATYFNELVRDMAPAGIKLDEQNYAEAALGMYNKYKETIEEGKTPEEAKENVKKLIKGDISTLILQSLDSGSQEIVGDLQGLYADAQKDLQAILNLNKALEEDPKADWTKLAKKFGVKGEFLDKLGKMEGDINDAVGKYGDYYQAGKIIYRGMSGHSGDKIESLFELGATFGGKIPVLGRFVEMYFKVAQEMLKATGRLGKLLQARQQGCVGVGTVGWIQTITSFTNDRNVTFSKQFPNVTACAVNNAMEFYSDVYEVIGSESQLYFWTGSGFVVGNPKGGGISAVKALRAWLRSNNHVDKSGDMEFIARSYNFPPGFLERQKQAELLAEDINKMITALSNPLYCISSTEFNDLIYDKGGIQEVIDSSDEWVSASSWRFSLPVQQVVDKMIEDRYIKEQATFSKACLEAQRKLKEIRVVRIDGEVFEKKPNGDLVRPSGISIFADPMDRITETCSSFVTEKNGFFKIVLIKDSSDSFSISLQADDGTDNPPETSVSISGDKKKYMATLSIERECKEDEELDDKGNCVPACNEGGQRNAEGICVPSCKEDEVRDDQGNCVPFCKEGEERDDKGKCVPVCNEGEELNDEGKCVPICEEGQEPDAKGQCVPVCKENETRDENGKCVPACEEGLELDANGKCVPICKENEKRDSDGICYDACGANARVSPTDPNMCECLDDYEVFGDNCVAPCEEGEERDSSGKCSQPCSANEERADDGSCICISGFAKDKDGVCQAVSDTCTSDSDCPQDYTCNTGTGECEFQKQPTCTNDSDCPKGYGCNTLTGECVFENTPPCTSDIECSTGYTCNKATGDCIFTRMPGCKELGCPEGYECNEQTDQCQYVKPSGCQETGCPDGYECNSQTGECQYIKLGCQSDSDCSVGFVCNTGSGQCTSPFDENYTNFGNTLTVKDDARNQDNADQVTSDSQPPGKGTKFTSNDLDSDINDIEEEIKNLPVKPPVQPTAPPAEPPPAVAETPPDTPPETPPDTPPETPPPATTKGIDIVEVGTAPPGQCLIVSGQLVPVKGYKEQIAGMTLTLTGAVNQTATSSGSGSFNFQLIPAGDYVIAVTQWNYGMTKQGFTAPSGKSIKITLKGSCPYLYVWNGENYEQENDIYSVARVFPAELMSPESRMYADRDGFFVQQVSVDNLPDELIQKRSYKDYYQISRPLQVDKEGYYRLMVREQAYERSFSDLLELWAVDHHANQQTGTTRTGRLFLYDSLTSLASQPEEKTTLYNGDSFEIKIPDQAFQSGIIAIDWQGFMDGQGFGRSSGKGRPRVSLQRKDPTGVWQTIDWAYPRDEQQRSFFILDDFGSGWDADHTIRLTALSCDQEKFHKINKVSWGHYRPGTPKSTRLALVSALKSGNEDVRKEAVAIDGKSVFLAPEEEVRLKYQSIPRPEGFERTFIFVSKGVYIPMPMIRVTAATTEERKGY